MAHTRTYLPPSLWGLHPLYSADVHLLCAHLQYGAVESDPELRESHYLYGHHPLSAAQIAGTVTAVDIRDTRVTFVVDDGTGSVQATYFTRYQDGSSTELPRELRVGDAVCLAGTFSWRQRILVIGLQTREISVQRLRILKRWGDLLGIWSRTMDLHSQVYCKPLRELMPSYAPISHSLRSLVSPMELALQRERTRAQAEQMQQPSGQGLNDAEAAAAAIGPASAGAHAATANAAMSTAASAAQPAPTATLNRASAADLYLQLSALVEDTIRMHHPHAKGDKLAAEAVRRQQQAKARDLRSRMMAGAGSGSSGGGGAVAALETDTAAAQSAAAAAAGSGVAAAALGDHDVNNDSESQDSDFDDGTDADEDLESGCDVDDDDDAMMDDVDVDDLSTQPDEDALDRAAEALPARHVKRSKLEEGNAAGDGAEGEAASGRRRPGGGRTSHRSAGGGAAAASGPVAAAIGRGKRLIRLGKGVDAIFQSPPPAMQHPSRRRNHEEQNSSAPAASDAAGGADAHDAAPSPPAAVHPLSASKITSVGVALEAGLWIVAETSNTPLKQPWLPSSLAADNGAVPSVAMADGHADGLAAGGGSGDAQVVAEAAPAQLESGMMPGDAVNGNPSDDAAVTSDAAGPSLSSSSANNTAASSTADDLPLLLTPLDVIRLLLARHAEFCAEAAAALSPPAPASTGHIRLAHMQGGCAPGSAWSSALPSSSSSSAGAAAAGNGSSISSSSSDPGPSVALSMQLLKPVTDVMGQLCKDGLLYFAGQKQAQMQEMPVPASSAAGTGYGITDGAGAGAAAHPVALVRPATTTVPSYGLITHHYLIGPAMRAVLADVQSKWQKQMEEYDKAVLAGSGSSEGKDEEMDGAGAGSSESPTAASGAAKQPPPLQATIAHADLLARIKQSTPELRQVPAAVLGKSIGLLEASGHLSIVDRYAYAPLLVEIERPEVTR